MTYDQVIRSQLEYKDNVNSKIKHKPDRSLKSQLKIEEEFTPKDNRFKRMVEPPLNLDKYYSQKQMISQNFKLKLL